MDAIQFEYESIHVILEFIFIHLRFWNEIQWSQTNFFILQNCLASI